MRDPTHSAGLRRQGRAIVARRVHALHQSLRYSFQDEDVAGLRRGDNIATRTAFINWYESVSHKLARAEDMVENVIYQNLTQQDWTRELIETSVQRGLDQVEQELQASVGAWDASEVSRLHAHAAIAEIHGVAGETQRRVLRHVVHALDAKQSPETLMREVRKVLEKITKTRLNMMINMGVVKAVNAGKLFGYEMLGGKQVGINPEWLRAPRIDAAKRRKSPEQKILEPAMGKKRAAIVEEVIEAVEEAEEEVLVNILTAGDDKV